MLKTNAELSRRRERQGCLVAGCWLLGAGCWGPIWCLGPSWYGTAPHSALPLELWPSLWSDSSVLWGIHWSHELLCWQAAVPLSCLYIIVFLFWGQSSQILVKTVQQTMPHNSVFGHNCWLGGRAIYESLLSTNWKEKEKKPTKRRWTLQAQKIQCCNMILAAGHACLWLTLQPVKGGRGGGGAGWPCM